MVGDLALLGMDLHGFVVAHRSGHHTNASLVRRLLQGVEKEKEHSSRAPGIPLQDDGTLDIQGIIQILPHRYPSCWSIGCSKFKPGGASSRSRT